MGEETSEQSVYQACKEAAESSSGLVIADFSARNFERLESFQEIAQEVDRQLVVSARDIYMLQALSSINGFDTSKPLGV